MITPEKKDHWNLDVDRWSDVKIAALDMSSLVTYIFSIKQERKRSAVNKEIEDVLKSFRRQ